MSSSTPSPSLAAAAPAGETVVVVKKEFGADDDGSQDRCENQENNKPNNNNNNNEGSSNGGSPSAVQQQLADSATAAATSPLGAKKEFIAKLMKSGLSAAAATASGTGSSATQRVSPRQATAEDAAAAASAATADAAVTESRTIYKVKRFLCTLIQFGTEISAETGEKVKELVFNLVAGTISVGDFHHVLQEVTNFPLRPFVLPFLKANIPLLSRDVTALAVRSPVCQSPLEYLRSHQSLLLIGVARTEPAMNDIFHGAMTSAPSFSSKRRSSSGESAENNDAESLMASVAKRARAAPGLLSDEAKELQQQHQRRQQQRVYPQPWSATAIPNYRDQDQQNQQPQQHQNMQQDDEWRNIHVMLNCILGMVDKTKRALAILQQRQHQQQQQQQQQQHQDVMDVARFSRRPSSGQSAAAAASASASSGGGSAAAGAGGPAAVSDLLAATIRNTEEKVVEVRRRAEEAVQEVKRAAMAELQRAVAMAERRAIESVAGERIKMERMIVESATAAAALAASQQAAASTAASTRGIGIDPSLASTSSSPPEAKTSGNGKQSPLKKTELFGRGKVAATAVVQEHANCWNCGRQASETCSGCNAARYCSQFCQHKDWEGHHKVCAVAKKVAASVATSTASAATAAMASVAGIKKRDEAGDDGDDEDEDNDGEETKEIDVGNEEDNAAVEVGAKKKRKQPLKVNGVLKAAVGKQ